MDIEMKYNLTERNCNFILSKLYEKRDRISSSLDKYMMLGLDIDPLNSQYQNLVDDIDQICRWRSDHPGCLLEGDPGYGCS